MPYALVAQRGSDTLGLVDIAAGRIIDAIWVGDEPGNVILSQDGSMAYVALSTESAVVAVDMGARAVVAILTDEAEISDDDVREFAVDAIDSEDRLVQWLNDIIVAAIIDGFLFAKVDALELDGDQPARLRARIRGQADARERIVTELKSVTYHDLQLTATGTRAECRVVIDV